MKLNPAQLGLHWRLWKRVTAVLFPNSAIRIPQSELDAKRHALYVQATGEELSLTDMNNAQFDLVKGAMLAIVEPGNLNAQLHALNGQRKRLLFGIRKLARSMDAGEAYVQAIIDRMDEHGALSRHSSHVTRHLADLHPRELTKVMIALRKHEKRGCLHAPISVDVHTAPSDTSVARANADPF